MGQGGLVQALSDAAAGVERKALRIAGRRAQDAVARPVCAAPGSEACAAEALRYAAAALEQASRLMGDPAPHPADETEEEFSARIRLMPEYQRDVARAQRTDPTKSLDYFVKLYGAYKGQRLIHIDSQARSQRYAREKGRKEPAEVPFMSFLQYVQGFRAAPTAPVERGVLFSAKPRPPMTEAQERLRMSTLGASSAAELDHLSAKRKDAAQKLEKLFAATQAGGSRRRRRLRAHRLTRRR